MHCSLSLSLPLFLLLLPLFPSLSSNKLPPISLPPSEAETLFKVMESMSSNQNWRLSHPNPCEPSSWPGIECKPGNNNFLHVSRLDFGTPPNPTCKPNAAFPSLIFSLPHLQSIFFFNCFTQTRASLAVPLASISNSSLQQLSLRSNPALVGPIPPEFSSLKSLKILTLSQNRLSGAIPLEIFELRSLVHLDLSYNMISGNIPAKLGNLRSLVGLDLSYNLLSGSIPTEIGHLGLLQKVDLSSNSLSGNVPEGIRNLKFLAFLALSNNRITGNFPKGFEKLQSLQYFIMDDNPMQIPLPLELGKLVKLQELRLANSGYSGSIPQSFSELKNLSSLSLQNNHLSGEIPVGFCTFSRIYHLNLSRNSLSGTVPFNSSFLKRLGKNLDLSGNPGLCLSSSEAKGEKFGINVCGSFVQPMKKSTANSRFSFSFPFLGFVLSLILHHLLF